MYIYALFLTALLCVVPILVAFVIASVVTFILYIPIQYYLARGYYEVTCGYISSASAAAKLTFTFPLEVCLYEQRLFLLENIILCLLERDAATKCIYSSVCFNGEVE